MKKLIQTSLALSILSQNAFAATETIPVCTTEKYFSVVKLPDNLEGTAYMRVHPNGKEVIFSGDSSASIVDFHDSENPKVIETNMRNEAYPVEGNWKLISVPNAVDGRTMEYYDYEMMKQKGKGQAASFSDSEHNEWYQSASELPGSTPKLQKFRTVLWSKLKYRDYSVPMDENGKAGKVKAGPIKSLCSNLDQQLYSPIVSKDGKFVGVESDSGQTIYKVDGDNCKVVHSLEVTTGKISFDFPRGWFQKNRPPRFTYSSHMIDEGSYSFGENVGMLYDPKTEKNIRISPNVPGSISYPGFAKDGKIVMLRYGSGGNELLTVDADKITDLYNKDKKAYNAALGLNCTKPGSPSSSPTSTIPASGSSSGSGTD